MPKKTKRGGLAASVRRLREGKGWSIYRLAKESGLRLQTIMMIEQGADAKWSSVVKLADALSASLEEFRAPKTVPVGSEPPK